MTEKSELKGEEYINGNLAGCAFTDLNCLRETAPLGRAGYSR